MLAFVAILEQSLLSETIMERNDHQSHADQRCSTIAYACFGTDSPLSPPSPSFPWPCRLLRSADQVKMLVALPMLPRPLCG